jgi:hypothetical protein
VLLMNRNDFRFDMTKVRNVTNKSLQDEVQSALKWLKSHSTKSTLEGMARYAIPSDKALGVAYKDMKVLPRAKSRTRRRALGHRRV